MKEKSVILLNVLLFQDLCDRFRSEGGENTMKKANEIFVKVIKSTVEKTLTADANRTSCAIIYQPKAPAKLDVFKKNKE